MSSSNSENSSKESDLLEELFLKIGTMHINDKKEDQKENPIEWNNIKTMEDIANYIKSGNCKNIAVLCGAGISTTCGIPDFRSDKTGIFSNLEEYNLPYPEAIFDYDYFVDNPLPFYEFSRKILTNVLKAKPSKAHYFIKLLQDKNLLIRVYSQNIDGLEEKAGIKENLICCVHGSLKHAYCIECQKFYDKDLMIKKVMNKEIPNCVECNGFIKPSIVFYGEPLPKNFPKCLNQDYNKIDLLIIMGTSLTVYPVSYIADMLRTGTPRLLINKTSIGKILVKPQNTEENIKSSSSLFSLSSSSGMDKNVNNYKRNFHDVFYKDSCDNGCIKLVQLLGWEKEFEALYKDIN